MSAESTSFGVSDLLGDDHARGIGGGDALARSTVRVSVQPDVSVVAVRCIHPGIEELAACRPRREPLDRLADRKRPKLRHPTAK